MRGWKLFRLRKDGTLGPLFINQRQRIPVGVWLPAESHRTKGFAFRPGWHIWSKRSAPRLSKRGRVWARVSFLNGTRHQRPASQGGLWYTADWMRVEWREHERID